MDRVRKSIASVGVTTYLGSLEFLDCQTTFDSIFWPTPIMRRVSKRAAGSCATEETDYLANKLNKYCDLCQLHLFCSIIELQFVGTKTYDTHRMMHDIYLALSGLKLNFVHEKNLFLFHRTRCINVLLNSHPSFPPMTQLGPLASVHFFTTH